MVGVQGVVMAPLRMTTAVTVEEWAAHVSTAEGAAGGQVTAERNDCRAGAGANAVPVFAIVRTAKMVMVATKAAAAPQRRSRATRAVMTAARTVTMAMSTATTA